VSNYDLGYEVRRVLSTYSDLEGCSRRAAIRDALTELARLAIEERLDFDALVDAAIEVAQEGVELDA
jgi:hypothetical protein